MLIMNGYYYILKNTVKKIVNLYDEIRLIEANNVDTFSNGGVLKEKSLFKSNDTFSLETYGKNFFMNNNAFNNGDSFSYKVTIKEVK